MSSTAKQGNSLSHCPLYSHASCLSLPIKFFAKITFLYVQLLHTSWLIEQIPGTHLCCCTGRWMKGQRGSFMNMEPIYESSTLMKCSFDILCNTKLKEFLILHSCSIVSSSPFHPYPILRSTKSNQLLTIKSNICPSLLYPSGLWECQPTAPPYQFSSPGNKRFCGTPRATWKKVWNLFDFKGRKTIMFKGILELSLSFNGISQKSRKSGKYHGFNHKFLLSFKQALELKVKLSHTCSTCIAYTLFPAKLSPFCFSVINILSPAGLGDLSSIIFPNISR